MVEAVALRVLQIEDDPGDAELARHRLGKAGYAVEPHRVDTKSALAKALDGQAWDLILIDYNLPRLNFADAIGAVRSRLPIAPVVTVTGAVGEETAVEVIKAGANDIVLKDHLDRLPSVVVRAISEARIQAERDEARRQLEETEEWFRQLTELTAEWYWSVGPDFRITYISDTTQFEMPDLIRGSVVGMDWRELHDKIGMDPDPREELLAAARNREPFYEAVFGYHNGRGEKIWYALSGRPFIDADGEYKGYRGVARNITAQKNIEAERDRERAFLRTLLNTIQDPIVACDSDAKLTLFNRAAEATFGGLVPELAAEEWARQYGLYSTDGREALPTERMSIMRALAGEVVDANEFSVLDEKGGRRVFRASASAIRDPAGNIDGAVVASRDVTDLYTALDEVTRKQEQYQTVFEGTREGLYVVDPDGAIVDVNSAGRVHGYARESIVGKDARLFVVPEDRPKFDDLKRAALNGETYHDEWRGLKEDGGIAYLRVVGSRIDLEGRPYLLIGVQDITKHKDAERQLKHSEQRFRDMAGLLADWFWETDTDQRFTWMTRTNVFLPSDTSPDFVIGKTRQELYEILGYDGDVADRVEACMKAGEPFRDFVFSIGHPELGTVWISISGKPFYDENGELAGYRGVGRDVTERVQHEQAVRDSEARLRAVLDNAPLGISLKDANGNVLLVNRSFAEACDRSVEEIVGRDTTYILEHDPESVREYLALEKETIETGRTLRVERPMIIKGERRDVVTIKFPIFGEDGQVEQVGTIINDLTKQRMTERALAQSQKMESLGKLTGGIAHDFNNILAVTLTSAELLLDWIEPNGDGRMRSMAQAIVDSALRGSRLTHRLLAFARQQSLEPETVEVAGFLDDLVPLLKRTLGEHIEIEKRADPGIWGLRVDVGQLENGLINLAVNARDAMPTGGVLRIEAANATIGEDDVLVSDGALPGDYVRISVSDTGVGMDRKTRERVFEPFFTTKETGKGTGLGLSMVYGFVMQSGGTIGVESEPGAGTTVSLYLPRDYADAQRDAAAGDGRDMAAGGAEHILVVEDEDLVRTHVALVLEGMGYKVSQAENAEHARKVLLAENRIDLLFTDLVMPGGTLGHELAAEARKMRPGIKVLLTTGYAGPPGDIDEELGRGAQLLNKPFQKRELAEKIRGLLDE